MLCNFRWISSHLLFLCTKYVLPSSRRIFLTHKCSPPGQWHTLMCFKLETWAWFSLIENKVQLAEGHISWKHLQCSHLYKYKKMKTNSWTRSSYLVFTRKKKHQQQHSRQKENKPILILTSTNLHLCLKCLGSEIFFHIIWKLYNVWNTQFQNLSFLR